MSHDREGKGEGQRTNAEFSGSTGRARPGSARGGARTCGGAAGRCSPRPAPSAGPPRPAGSRKRAEQSRRGTSRPKEAPGRSLAAPAPRAPSPPDGAGAMGAPRRGPPVFPGPPPGLLPLLLLLLLLLSGLAPGRASPRLLEHPAPVCSQQVRPGRVPEARAPRGCCGGGGRRGPAAGDQVPRAGRAGSLRWGSEAWAQRPGRTVAAVGVAVWTWAEREFVGVKDRAARVAQSEVASWAGGGSDTSAVAPVWGRRPRHGARPERWGRTAWKGRWKGAIGGARQDATGFHAARRADPRLWPGASPGGRLGPRKLPLQRSPRAHGSRPEGAVRKVGARRGSALLPREGPRG